MKRHTGGLIRLAALIVSVGAHGALFYHFAERPLSTAGGAPKLGELSRVTMRFAPEPVEAEPEPEPEPEPVVEPEPEPEPEPPPPPPPKPKPKPKPEPKPKPKKVHKPKPSPKPKPKPAVEAVQAAPAPAPLPVATPAQRADPALREAYLAHLLAYIEGYKEYPRIARRRRIEGRVNVSFQLLEGGRIAALNVVGGHKSLRKAARAAVEKALPLPMPTANAGVKLPMAVKYAMEFKLK